MKNIKMNQTIKEILAVEPLLLDELINLGFKPLANPISLKAVASVMTLEKACDHINLDRNKLIESFSKLGVTIDE